MLKSFAIFHILVLICSCATTTDLYRSYTPITNAENIEKAGFTITKPPTARDVYIYDVPNALDDTGNIWNELESKGYILTGYIQTSEYDEYTPFGSNVLHFAFKQGAHAVIYSIDYLGSSSSAVPLTLPDNKTTSYFGNIYNGASRASFSGTSTTYGSKTTYIPITTHHYAYKAAIFAKTNWCQRNKFGALYSRPNARQRNQIGMNNGLIVVGVCENSLAFKHDIMKWDVLVEINGKLIDSFEAYTRELNEGIKNGQVRFSILHAGKIRYVDVRGDENTIVPESDESKPVTDQEASSDAPEKKKSLEQ